jgi:hypothetical protein
VRSFVYADSVLLLCDSMHMILQTEKKTVNNLKVNLKFTLEQAKKAQRGSRCTAPLFL